MRKLFVFTAISALLFGLSACASSGPGKQAEGVTGATIKRAAVGGNFVDFGHDANSVENYDLQSQSVSLDNPIATDEERDQEIDAIVNTISNDDAVSPSAPPPGNSQRPVPAVPEDSQRSELSGPSIGVTGGVAPVTGQVQLPPVPESAGNPAAGEDATMAAERERLFPKPRWRREHESKTQKSQSVPASASASGN